MVYVKEYNGHTGVGSFAAQSTSSIPELPTSTVAKLTANMGMIKAGIGSTVMFDDGTMYSLKTSNTWTIFE